MDLNVLLLAVFSAIIAALTGKGGPVAFTLFAIFYLLITLKNANETGNRYLFYYAFASFVVNCGAGWLAGLLVNNASKDPWARAGVALFGVFVVFLFGHNIGKDLACLITTTAPECPP